LVRDIFVFFGPPGSGKGSLSKLLVDRLDWVQFSTGDMCRKHIADQTELGKEIDFAIKSGKLVSDDQIIAMVNDWLVNVAPKDAPLVIDGCPRTIAQAESLSNLIEKKFPNCNIRLINLTSSDEVLIDRILNRFICSNKKCQIAYSASKGSTQQSKIVGQCDACGERLVRRADDNEEAIRERLTIYRQHADGVLNYFVSIGKDIEVIDAMRPLEKVFSDFKEKIS
jgi:adenylate kinase